MPSKASHTHQQVFGWPGAGNVLQDSIVCLPVRQDAVLAPCAAMGGCCSAQPTQPVLMLWLHCTVTRYLVMLLRGTAQNL